MFFRHGQDPWSEPEALLVGTYVEFLERKGRPVPRWAWINLLAHGDEEALRRAAGARHRPFLDVNVWRHARGYLAGEVLEAAHRAGSLATIQAAVLVPLELDHMASPSSWRPRPGQWAAWVLAAMENHSRTDVDEAQRG
jgi:hypothetical protein